MTVQDGSVGATTKIVDNGPDADRWTVVILGDGYQAIEMGRYHLDVDNFVRYFRGVAPFDQLWRKINIYRVDVVSTDSFADDPVSCGDGTPANPPTGLQVATYFDSTFCGDGDQRSVLGGDKASARGVALARVPDVDLIFVMVNSPNLGGGGSRAGERVVFFSTHSSGMDYGIHEMGHSAFELADEYDGAFGGQRWLGSGPNITTETSLATIPWRDLILPGTPIPTSAPGVVGLYEGAGGLNQGVYRPEYECAMRHPGAPFCAVCRREIRARLAPFGGSMNWETDGNAGIDPATEFLGTTDSRPLVVKTNGAERLRVAANGNVGIGASIPGAMLELRDGDLLFKAAIENAGDIIFRNGAGIEKARIWSEPTAGTGLYLKSGDKPAASGGKNPDISINARGDVGIGTSRPAAKLEVNTGDLLVKGGDLLLKAGTRNVPKIIFQNVSGRQTSRIWSEAAVVPGLYLSGSSSSGPDVSISAAGNVGIGTSRPGAKLEINNGSLLLKANAGDIVFQSAAGIQKGRIWADPTAATGLHLSSGDSNPDISIDGAGNVGIGAAQPGAKLHVRSASAGGATLMTTNLANGLAIWATNADPASSFPTAAIQNYGTGAGVLGVAEQDSTTSFGVLGMISGGLGPVAQRRGGIGVVGSSATGVGVAGVSDGLTNINHGVEGAASGLGAGVYGHTTIPGGVGVAGENSGGGDAGRFFGNVDVRGTIRTSGKAFRIDHPLDPANKFLSHASIESPDMMNVYNGNVRTDGDGEAVVELPDYFEALNRDFRYQLTVIGAFAQVAIAREIKGNRFVIRSDRGNVKVSWQVTGIRRDPYAEAHRIQVEQLKGKAERGRYLHPELYASKSAKPELRRPIGSLGGMVSGKDVRASKGKPSRKKKTARDNQTVASLLASRRR